MAHPPRTSGAPAHASVAPLNDADLDRLQDLLAALPAPLEPMDVMALDGYLCGVILQPQVVPPARWQPGVLDVEGRPLPPGHDAAELMALVGRRHAELQRAIDARDWFDPWIYPDDEAAVSDSVLPWVAGFAAALDSFPALQAMEDPELVEPLALIYLHFDAEDLEDAEPLQAVIETIEPPADLAEAVQDLVRAVMLIADVTRPRTKAPPRRPAARPGGRAVRTPAKPRR
ncbi:YecA/YgfB family protein [Rubrivivax albus]|uniref:YecA family protein n=1 Tax=Rubrivivax albus TaxID=2499835 RepID=A0A3S2TME0_9BURK|nr:YecA family protein [Rubrivivax albus]RVT51702.1 YecA family protein [Rubrivivax albus]